MSRGPVLPGLTYLQHLGSGGYADVYLYEQASPRMNVAVKVLRADGIDDDIQARFTSEADVMARLSDHPFIVPVMHAALTDSGQPYIVMKYYPKPNLAVRARRGQFSVPDVLRIGIQVASAVETAHRAGILHRDIKPANILTSQYDEPGLTDFGIAAVTTSEGTGVTDGGMSISWAAPEVVFGMSDGDVRSDVYALGATLWHLLAGRPPYEEPGGDNSELALMRRTQSERVPSVPRDGVPESLQRLLRQALAKSADGRQQSALTLARGLQAVEQELHLPVTATVVPEDDPSLTPFVDGEPDEPATRVRGPRLVAAQPASTPADPDGDAATRLRAAVVPTPVVARPPVPRPRQPGPAQPVQGATTPSRLKQVDPPAADADAPAEPVARSRAAAVTAGLVAAVALVIGVVVVVATGSGSSPKAHAADEASDPQDVVDPAQALAPGTPRVTVKVVDAKTARFVISYDDAQPGDSLKWTRIGAGAPARGTVTKGLVDLRRPACLTVRAVRRSGLASAASTATCAP